MELGNLVFGCSRGECEVPRYAGFEQPMFNLMETIQEGCSPCGTDFENEVFEMHPYYWGDCTCGYDELEWEWEKQNHHENKCYQVALSRAQEAWLTENPEPIAQPFNTYHEELEPGIMLFSIEPAYSPSADAWREWYNKKWIAEGKIYDKLCAEFGVDRESGCAVHCTCDYEERFAKFCEEHFHSPKCPIVRPNFRYKPTQFELMWYKYFARDSYMNRPLSAAEFAEIIVECKRSL